MPFVARQPPRPKTRAPWARAADAPPTQQAPRGDLLVAFAPCQHRHDRLAASFRSQVQLGREPALGAAQSFVRRLTPR